MLTLEKHAVKIHEHSDTDKAEHPAVRVNNTTEGSSSPSVETSPTH